MRLALLALVLLAPSLSFAGDVVEPSFYYWRDVRGIPHYADELRNIPEMYRGQAQVRTWAQQYENTDKRFTVSDPVKVSVVVPVNEEVIPDNRDGCQGYATVTQAWLTVDGVTRMYYSLKDGCGKTLSTTPYLPPQVYHEVK